MKEYPLTEGELNELAFTGGFGTLAASASAFLFGLWIDVSKDVAMASDLTEAERAFWGAVNAACLIGTVVAAFFAALMFWRGHSRLGEIKKSTDHG